MNEDLSKRVSELVRGAVQAINNGLVKFAIVLPRRARGGGRRMVVFSKPRLYGEVACENAEGHTVVYVNAMDFLAYAAAAGLIEVKGPNGETL